MKILSALPLVIVGVGGRAALACPFCGERTSGDLDLAGTLLAVGAVLFVVRGVHRRLADQGKRSEDR